MTRFAFFDIEASGLSQRSYPIEIGWVFRNGRGASHLIRPHAGWDHSAWDSRSQAIHRIDPATLEAEGIDCVAAAVTMVEALSGAVAVCDGQPYDERWVNMIFAAAGMHRPFRIISIDYLLKHMGLSEEQIQAAFHQARQVAPPAGRALGDAKHIHAVARLAAGFIAKREAGK